MQPAGFSTGDKRACAQAQPHACRRLLASCSASLPGGRKAWLAGLPPPPAAAVRCVSARTYLRLRFLDAATISSKVGAAAGLWGGDAFSRVLPLGQQWPAPIAIHI